MGPHFRCGGFFSEVMAYLHAMGEGGHGRAGFFPEGGRHLHVRRGMAGTCRELEREPHGEQDARDIPAQCRQCPRGKSRPCPPGRRCFE